MSYQQRIIRSEFLDNFRLMLPKDFTSLYGLPSTNIYGWNNSGLSDFDGSGYIGDEDLTEVGALTARNNQIDKSVFCDFDGTNDLIYSSGTEFDTSDESFTMGGWFKFDRLGTALESLLGKYSSTDADKSFHLEQTASKTLLFKVYTDNAGTFQSIEIDSSLYHTDKANHIATFYNNNLNSMGLVINGKIVGYISDASLANRNNSANAKLTIGGYDGSGTPAGFFDGAITDIFYYKGVLTFDQIRQIYLTGSLLKGYKDNNGRIRINGESGPFGFFEKIKTSLTGYSSGIRTTLFKLNSYIKGSYEVGYTLNSSTRHSTNGYTYSEIVDSGANVLKNLQSLDLGVGIDGLAPNTPIIGDNVSQSTVLNLDENYEFNLRFEFISGGGSGHSVGKGSRLYWKLLDY